jgi:3-hydroxyacyl-CoA dehydrogenase
MTADGVALPESIHKMKASGATSFYRADGAVFDLAKGEYVARGRPALRDARRSAQGLGPGLKNDGAEAWDLGDGVLGITFKTKANSIDADVVTVLHQAIDLAEREFRAVVLANQGEHFCVGANLFMIAMAAGSGQWDQIRTVVKASSRAPCSA